MRSLTANQAAVLDYMARDPLRPYYGFEIMRAASLASGQMYRVLNRLLAWGWLYEWWEDVDPATVGRPPRHYYALTELGTQEAQDALAEFVRPGVIKPVLGPGLPAS